MEIAVPKLTTVFNFPDGRAHEVSLLEAVEAAMGILKRHEGTTGYAYVDEFKTWWEKTVKSADGNATITRDEAEWLCDTVFVEAAQQKKSRVDMLPSSISTAPSPPE